MRGLEPPLLTEHDPKSCASASSATSAICESIIKITTVIFLAGNCTRVD